MILDQFQSAIDSAIAGIRKVIIGQDAAIRYSLVVVLCNQHALIEGVPGLAKTLLARTLAAGDSTVAAGKLALPEASGVYPFAELHSAAAREHTWLTVCSAAPHGGTHGEISVTHESGAWQIAGTHRGQAVRVAIAVTGLLQPPVITL